MYQTRESIIIPDNFRSVAMSSAAASRIPRPVNVDTATPIAARRQPITDIARQLSSMSLAKGASTANPVVSKHQLKSRPTNIFTAKGVPASDRIQERRKLVAAKLGLPRPKHTISAVVPGVRKHVKLICHTLGQNLRQGPMHNIPGPVKLFVDFSDRVRNAPSRTPSDFSGCRPFTQGGYNLPATIKPVFLPLLVSSERGGLPYCENRWNDPNDNLEPCGYGLAYNGRTCPCHGPSLQRPGYHIEPRLWSTTPAEADVDPKRARRVRFAGTTTAITPSDDHGRYYRDSFWTPEDHAADSYGSYASTDPATKEDDDRAIALLDSAAAIQSAKLTSVDLQAVFDECNFTDDEE